MAKKVAGWGAFKRGYVTCYVDPDGHGKGKGKCYDSRPKLLKALTAEASA